MSVSAKELKRRSRAILSGRYSLPMGAFAVSQVISTCISLPFDISLQSNPTVFQFIISELATAIISLLYIVLKGGQAYVHLNMARGKNASIADVFRYFSRRPDRFNWDFTSCRTSCGCCYHFGTNKRYNRDIYCGIRHLGCYTYSNNCNIPHVQPYHIPFGRTSKCQPA